MILSQLRTDMEYPTETLTGDTESTSSGIEETAPGILCALTKISTQPQTPRETTLEIPILTIPGITDLYYTPINMNIFHQA